MLSSPRRPSSTMRIFSSAEWCRRVALRISRTVFSALSGMRLLACLIVAPQRGYDEPAILPYAISSICPTSADGLQGHMNHINASHHLEQLASYMGSGAVAGGGHVDLAEVGLGIGDELGDRLDRKRWIDLHDERFARDPCDRHDVTNEIETELFV